VSDAGVKDLAGLQRLTTLNLAFTQVTDAGLRYLSELKGLTRVGLRGTAVTDVGLAELRWALTRCSVIR
jgi:hypothetical protein